MNDAPALSQHGPGAVYFVFGKVLPAALFAVLAAAWFELLRVEMPAALTTFPAPASVGLFLNRVINISFAAAVALIYIFRAPPLRGRHDAPAVAVSMYASFVLLALVPILRFSAVAMASLPGWTLVLSNFILAAGAAFSIYALLYLRLNFSILPEARGLTTSGPYRLVRHPVYLGEITVALGLALALPSLLTILVLGTFVCAQLARIRMEEGVLAASLPGYAGYARDTPALFPFLRV